MPRKTKKENLFHHPHHRPLSWLVSEYGSYTVFLFSAVDPYTECVHFIIQGLEVSGAANINFRENISSEDDLRSRIFGTFVVKFLACLPLLGFSNV